MFSTFTNQLTTLNQSMIYPQTFERKTGFDEIRCMVSAQCISALGRERVDSMSMLTNVAKLHRTFDELKEMGNVLEYNPDFPLYDFNDMRQELVRVRPEGTAMEAEELSRLWRTLAVADAITKRLTISNDDEKDKWPILKELAQNMPQYGELVKRLRRIIDEEGEVRTDASPELARIRRARTEAEGSISHTLHAIMRMAQTEGWVTPNTDAVVRDGRLMIPIAPAMKRKIRGIVHDESASGRTVYIEPIEVVEANNKIRLLTAEERQEIHHILLEATKWIRNEIDGMERVFIFIGEIDFLQAKLAFCSLIGGIIPHPINKPFVDWSMARHPLLELSLKRNGETIVPLDICLEKDKRILIISGPNAGGKSVCLKTVGLLQYMIQCGLPVPMAESSRQGIFDSIFIDIGDEQSIDNDLSTYSGRLMHMKKMLRHATDKSLLLIDEFGSGTEPQIGGAIAQAALQRFVNIKAFGVITTHYHNLKHFADKTQGITNGAMLYDRHKMQPLFSLETGQPGSSFAIEIAKKIGLPKEVITDATKIVGQDYVDADKYLQDILRDKRYWEQKRKNINTRQKNIETTITRYETELADLQRNKNDIIAKARQEAEDLVNQANAKIEQTIKTIKEAQAEKERTKSAREDLADFKHHIQTTTKSDEEDRIARKIQSIKKRHKRYSERKETRLKTPSINISKAKEQPSMEAPLTAGDMVRIKGQVSVGKLEILNGKTAIVTFGTMRCDVSPDRLERVTMQQKTDIKNDAAHVSRQTRQTMDEKKLNFHPDLDVRGMRGNEAITAVTYFIDDATLLGMAHVRILHGTGSGILRTLIREYLSTVDSVKTFHDEHVQFGGAGYTVVDLI